MLVHLYIDNIAIIEHSEISFDSGFHVLTGETGAGKSIIIDAINAILGERTSHEIIRSGEQTAEVTAVFHQPSAKAVALMNEYGIEQESDGSLLLQRKLHSDGKSVCRINGKPVTASVLRAVGQVLINIHGQHANQALLNPQFHVNYIDRMGNLEEELENYHRVYLQAVGMKRKLMAMDTDAEEKARKMDLLNYQIQELEDAKLQIGERDQLQKKKSAILNNEKISSLLQQCKDAMNGGEEAPGALQMLEQASSSLENLCGYQSQWKELSERLRETVFRAEEVFSEIRDYSPEEEYDPSLLDQIEERLNEIYRLSLKYGEDEETMLAFLEKAREDLKLLTNAEQNKEQLQEEYYATALHAKELADALSLHRKEIAQKFTESVQQELAFLNMPGVVLAVDQQHTKLSPIGCDDIQFLIATNPGEQPRPLVKIASGGELSRIMLAIKNVLADKDDIDTLIFDEVDTGISGNAALKVGIKLHQTAKHRQVICVTHLAQIAAHADRHLLIQKTTDQGKAHTQVYLLDREGRKKELARIMSGGALTELQLQLAEEMLLQAGQANM